MTINFGLECHFKNLCDPYFREMGERKRQAATQHTIADIEQYCIDMREGAILKQRLDPSSPFESFMNYMPPEREKVRFHSVLPASIACGIMGCHSFEFTRKDERRHTH